MEFSTALQQPGNTRVRPYHVLDNNTEQHLVLRLLEESWNVDAVELGLQMLEQ
jgi:hypothetical protein